MECYVCITGATGGLGKAFAVECASRGWNIFMTDICEEALASLAYGLSAAYGVKVVYSPCDLTDALSRMRLAEMMKDRRLCFWSLINVAGIDYEGLFEEKTLVQIRTILRLNIESAVEMTHLVMDMRDKARPFRVINVSSLAAFYPMPVKALYAASKRFLLDFSLALREEIDLGGDAPTGVIAHQRLLVDGKKHSVEHAAITGTLRLYGDPYSVSADLAAHPSILRAHIKRCE
jgi:short-subunit dehydrogenase